MADGAYTGLTTKGSSGFDQSGLRMGFLNRGKRLNLSKSCLSLSSRNALVSFNWTKPRRTSAKVAGVQSPGPDGRETAGDP